MMTTAQLCWGVAAAVLLVLEGAIPGTLVCIWFMLGAVAALLVSLFCPLVWVQMLVFLAVSIGTLVLTRPLAVKKLQAKFQPTNADRVLGQTARVLVDILPGEKGRVRVDGLDWAAESDRLLVAGQSCTVQRIAGATLFVTAVCEDAHTEEKEEVTV